MINAHFLSKRLSFFNIRILFISGVLSVLISGCNDDPTEIGLNVLPDSDLIGVDDTVLYAEAYTMEPAGIMVTDSTTLPLGIYSDQVFGQTKAGFMIELSQYPVDTVMAGPEAVVDSVVLDLVYNSGGDSVKFPRIGVFSLTEGISKSQRYYTDYDYAGKFNPDNLVQGGTTKPDSNLHLKMFLDNNFGSELIHAPGVSDKELYLSVKNDSVFDANFKGLYLTPEANSDNIMIGVTSVRIAVYYHEDTIHAKFFYFLAGNGYGLDDDNITKLIYGDKFIKIFEHDGYTYSPDTINQTDNIYIQSMGGAQVLIRMPDLKSLNDILGNIIINRAELIIPVVSDSNELKNIPFPAQLGLRPKNDKINYIYDDYGFSQYNYFTGKNEFKSYIDGSYHPDINSYRFYLTHHFQNYFRGKVTSSDFILYSGVLYNFSVHTDYNTSSLNRIILGSGINPDKKIMLKLVYTIL